MNWFGAGVDWPLVVIRAIHFAASATTAGALVFPAVMAKPVSHSDEAIAKPFRIQTLRVAWIGLAVTLLSGAIWLLFQAVSMSGLPLSEAATSRVLSTVLNRTQFGEVAEIRCVLAVMLAACLAYDRFPPACWLAPVAALGLTASIAWTGHAASTLGDLANPHLAADVLHLSAAAIWIGGLVSLALLLNLARRVRSLASASLAQAAALRFSTLGIVSVGTLLASGFVNAWILVGSFNALMITAYGRLLLLKIVVFTVMLVFAAINRFRLTPRLAASSASEPQLEALRQLTRNSVIEIALGFTIFAIVGVLGTLHPAIHLVKG
jgi:putative copper resistance protein D